jgi:uncharacterized protein
MMYLYLLFAAALFIFPLLKVILNIYPEYLWFSDLGYQAVFLKIMGSKLLLGGISFVVAFVVIYINLRIAFAIRKRFKSDAEVVGDRGSVFNWETLTFDKSLVFIDKFNWLKVMVSVVIGLLMCGGWVLNWEKVQLFINASSFAKADPLFNKDIGFYFFKYPLYQQLQGWLSTLIILCLAIAGAIYATGKAIIINGLRVDIKKAPKVHLSILLAIFFLLLAWLFRLNMYQLLYSPSGIVYGAGYTDIFADLIGYKALVFVSVIIAFLTIMSIFRKGILLPIEGTVALFVVFIVLKGVYPSVVQNLSVKPNEIEKERPYISYHISYTRDAYQLNKIKEKSIDIRYDLSAKSIQNNTDTIENVRLWDHRPLLKTLAQLQEIRLYYDFYDVDIDRYIIDGKYQQVMLSARELNADQIPVKARNWINQKLTYTHGYGVVMLPVNKKTPEGLPTFYLYDIPPKSTVGLTLDNPSIYFGEATNSYIITNTKAKEFDYPKGDSNVYAEYKSPKGIVLNNLLKKIVFAIKFQEVKFLFSNYITRESKVLYDRNIMKRVKKVAPFLTYENDPYIVISKGKLYWILDAFTISSKYPYSQPFYRQYNYLRNSVKVVVDAYTGEMTFYIVDKSDPLIRSYAKIFPHLFKDVSTVDPSIKSHFRYPQYLFSVQSKMYETFHMQDPQVFYNQEDLWTIPNETYDENIQPVEPYYTMIKLPEDKGLTFRLMMPFSPAKKNNMIAWMSANSDEPNYGDITVYKLPKDELIYGPMQIESRIDQDTRISQLLTLWGQKGSRVIRGNLLVIPIENSFLYVEPIYLQATQSRFPELKQVVVAYKSKLVMADTFAKALKEILNLHEVVTIETDNNSVDPGIHIPGQTLKQLIDRANTMFNESEKAMRKLDWTTYGNQTKQLGDILKQIKATQVE